MAFLCTYVIYQALVWGTCKYLNFNYSSRKKKCLKLPEVSITPYMYSVRHMLTDIYIYLYMHVQCIYLVEEFPLWKLTLRQNRVNWTRNSDAV